MAIAFLRRDAANTLLKIEALQRINFHAYPSVDKNYVMVGLVGAVFRRKHDKIVPLFYLPFLRNTLNMLEM